MLYLRNLLILGIAVAVVVRLYLSVYNRIINARIAQGRQGCRLPEPGSFLYILLIGALIILLLSAGSGLVQTVSSDASDMRCYLQAFPEEELPDSWAGVYTKEQNPGYTRREAEDGLFSFIIFESSEPYDGLHPDFLIWVSYRGEEPMEALGWNGSFVFPGEGRTSGAGAAGAMTPNLLVVGSAVHNAEFTLQVTAYASMDQVLPPETAAGETESLPAGSASGSVTLSLHGGILP